MTLLSLPLVRQSFDYSCGAASLASVLYYWGVWDGREPELYGSLGTNCEGTSGGRIMEVARGYGLSVSYESGMSVDRLIELAGLGKTVILNIQAWGENYIGDWSDIWEEGHYVVLVGVCGQEIIMMDPSLAGRYGKMGIKEFENRWHDWSDDGAEKEYHTGIIIKGEKAERLVPGLIM